MTNNRATYTIPEPERSMFRALSAKTKTSEAELLRKFIRWACELAKVTVPAAPAAGVYTFAPGDSFGESQGESMFAGVVQGDSGGENGLTADG